MLEKIVDYDIVTILYTGIVVVYDYLRTFYI